MAEQPRSRGASLAIWIGFNLLRLFGVGVIVAGIAIQGLLLVRDVKANSNPVSTSSNSSDIPSASSQTLLSSGASTLSGTAWVNPTQTESVAFPTASIGAPALPSASSPGPETLNKLMPTASDVPSLLFPDGMVGSATPTEPVIPMAIQPALPEGYATLRVSRRSSDDVRDGEGAADLPMQSNDTGGGVQRYFDRSTVPDQTGGLLFAILDRLMILVILLTLCLGELGVPETFLVKHLSAISMVSTSLWLGLGKIWVGFGMQRHAVPTDFLVPGHLLVISGVLNVLCSLPLIYKQHRANSFPNLCSREIYLAYNLSGRLLFWKPVPDIAYRKAYDTGGLAAMLESKGDDEEPDDVDNEKWTHDLERGEEYPTFTGGALTDPVSQIARLDRRQSRRMSSESHEDRYCSDAESETDEEDTAGSMSALAPEAPTIMPGIPPQLQGLVRDVQPRFGAGVPVVNLQPSTPSTIASRSRSRSRQQRDTLTRPGTSFSVSSGSTTGSSQSQRVDLLRRSVDSFPIPPERDLEIPPKSRPKSHLTHPPMDSSKLMPPKMGKSANARARSRSRSSSRPPTELGLQEWKMPTKPGSTVLKPASVIAASSRRSVRFDLEPDSSDESSRLEASTQVSSSMRGKRIPAPKSYPHAYVEDESDNGQPDDAGYLSASSFETELGYRRKGGAIV